MINVLTLEYSKIKVIYKIDEEEVGFILLENTIDVINIVDVFVKEKYRRKGIACKMFKYIFEMYKDRKVKYMWEVREDNIKAYNLYIKLGFKKIYVRKKYYKTSDAIIMEAK